LNYIWTAFWTLHKGRRNGFSGIEPIAVSEILLYGKHMELPINTLLTGVQILDHEFIKCIEERNKKSTTK
jgi:hypothetical protein